METFQTKCKELTPEDICFSIIEKGKSFINEYSNMDHYSIVSNRLITSEEIYTNISIFISYCIKTFGSKTIFAFEDLKAPKKLPPEYILIPRRIVKLFLFKTQIDYLKNTNQKLFDRETIVAAFVNYYIYSQLNVSEEVYFGKVAKQKQKCFDRETTIRHFLTIIIQKYDSISFKKSKIEDFISKTKIIKSHDFLAVSLKATASNIDNSYYKESNIKRYLNDVELIYADEIKQKKNIKLLKEFMTKNYINFY